MSIEIEEMTVDVDDARPEHTPPTPAPAVPVDAVLRQVLAALTDYETLRQRLVAD
jgi:hypothetical protein